MNRRTAMFILGASPLALTIPYLAASPDNTPEPKPAKMYVVTVHYDRNWKALVDPLQIVVITENKVDLTLEAVSDNNKLTDLLVIRQNKEVIGYVAYDAELAQFVLAYPKCTTLFTHCCCPAGTYGAWIDTFLPDKRQITKLLPTFEVPKSPAPDCRSHAGGRYMVAEYSCRA